MKTDVWGSKGYSKYCGFKQARLWRRVGAPPAVPGMKLQSMQNKGLNVVNDVNGVIVANVVNMLNSC